VQKSSVIWLAATAAAAADDLPATNSQSGWVVLILRELGRSQATGFVFDVAKWTLLGALLGMVVALLACVLFSRLGWYHVPWRRARAFRWTLFGLTGVLSAFLFGFAGFWSGAVQGSERVLSKSQLATDLFPRIADAIADGMAWIQIRAAGPGNTNDAELSLKLEAFRAGKWELHAGQLLEQFDAFRDEALAGLLAKLEQSTLERAPQLKGGIGERLLHQLLSGLGRLLVEKKVVSELNNFGADRIYRAIREQLRAEAAKAGNPDTIARGEVSPFLVREGIVPGILNPIRSTARAQQLSLVAIAILVMVVPPVCVRLARSRFAGRSQTSSTPPPAPSTVP